MIGLRSFLAGLRAGRQPARHVPRHHLVLCALLFVARAALAEPSAEGSVERAAISIAPSVEARKADDPGAGLQPPVPGSPTKSRSPAANSRAQGTRKSTRRTAADKNCEAAEKKLAKERNYLKKVEDEIVASERSLESCKSKSTCAKYDADLQASKRLKVRHEHRVEKFGAERDEACAAKS